MHRLFIVVMTLFVGVALIAGSFAAGAYVQREWPSVTELLGIGPLPASSLGDRVEEVERILDREALSPSSDESQTAGAVDGLLRSLDDTYAAYFDGRHYQYFQEQSEGEFYGIGVTISQREDTVYVVSVIEGTPAEEAGLEADDEIVSIDGDTKDWDLDEVVRRIRGPEGTTVDVGIFRPDDDKKLEFTIERAQIDIPNTEQRLEGDVGYVRLLGFNVKSAEDLRGVIEELDGQGAESFVLDLRDNPGGLLQSSVEIASLFVADGVIVRVEDRRGFVDEYRATGGKVTDKPLVILMNENSASASEVLAGALQDYDRAELVGERSFGKASVQTVEQLSWGGGIKFTIAHYVTPKGRAIDGVGLEPDVKVEMDPEKQREPETDVQLQRALEVARGQ